MKEDYAEYLINKTKEDYNLIASHFSNTRKHIWKDLVFIINYITPEDKVLDLGCGNGRFYELVNKRTNSYTGIDISEKLIAEAKRKYPKATFKVADAAKLPFSENSFDKVLSIAVLHHIPSKKLQKKFFEEIKKILRPKGLLILTVWDLWGNLRAKKLIFKYGFFKIIGLSKFDFKDIFYSWKSQDGQVIAERYIHCFTKKEISKLARKTGFRVKEIKKIGENPGINILLIAEKI